MSLVAKPSISASSWTLRFIKYNDNLSWIFHTSAVTPLSLVPIYTFDITIKIFADGQANAGQSGDSPFLKRNCFPLCSSTNAGLIMCADKCTMCSLADHAHCSAVLQVNERCGCSAQPSPVFSTRKEAGSCCRTCITGQISLSMRGWSRILQPEVDCTATCVALIATSVAPKVAK